MCDTISLTTIRMDEASLQGTLSSDTSGGYGETVSHAVITLPAFYQCSEEPAASLCSEPCNFFIPHPRI
jgi:hypothetical protein